MRKYVYKNATVYITEPTEAHLSNIRKATEKFVNKLAKEGLIGNGDKRRNNRGVSNAGSNAVRRNRKAKKEN